MDISQLCFVQPSHPILSQVAEEIKAAKITSKPIRDLIKNMMKIAGVERGNPSKKVMVGLAAPQIGVSKRIILVDPGANGRGGISSIKVYINPKITSKSEEEMEWYEACYSTAHVAGVVMRAKTITVAALDENGDEVTETHTGYVARIFQHEIDHLNGKRFPDLIQDPAKLHFVKPDEMLSYRNEEQWRDWPHKCSRVEWEAIRKGNHNVI